MKNNEELEANHAYTAPLKEDSWAKNVVCIGSGGFGRECSDIIKAMERSRRNVRFLGYLDENPELHGKKVKEGDIIYGGLDYFKDPSHIYFIVGIGNPKIRKDVTIRAMEKGYKPITVIYPTVIIKESVNIGVGCVIQEGARIANGCQIGNHVHLNFDTLMGHDSIVRDYVEFNPKAQIMGDCLVEDCVYLGPSATVFRGIRIGENSVIGGGSVVTKNIPKNVKVVGVPARITENRG